jgi:hypothetical protein
MIVSIRPGAGVAYRYDAAQEAARARERNLSNRHTRAGQTLLPRSPIIPAEYRQL